MRPIVKETYYPWTYSVCGEEFSKSIGVTVDDGNSLTWSAKGTFIVYTYDTSGTGVTDLHETRKALQFSSPFLVSGESGTTNQDGASNNSFASAFNEQGGPYGEFLPDGRAYFWTTQAFTEPQEVKDTSLSVVSGTIAWYQPVDTKWVPQNIIGISTTYVSSATSDWTTTTAWMTVSAIGASWDNTLPITTYDYSYVEVGGSNITANGRNNSVSARSVTVYPEPGGILVYFSEDNMAFTDGEVITNADYSTSYSYTVDLLTSLVTYTEIPYTNEYDDGEGNTYTWEEYWYESGSIILKASTEETTATPPEYYWGTSYSTISAPRRGWGANDTITTQELILSAFITTSTRGGTPVPFTASGSTETSYSSSGTGPYYDYGTATGRVSGATAYYSESAKTLTFNTPQSTTFMPGGEVYLIATSQSGAVIASEGFHTTAPASWFKGWGDEAWGFDTRLAGAARPGVRVFVPYTTPTPIYPVVAASYFGGNAGINNHLQMFHGGGFAIPTSLGEADGTIVYTSTTGNGDTTITPNIFQLSRKGQSVALTSTIELVGSAGTYGRGGSYAGGYSDLSVTWTLVVGSPGVVVAYADGTSDATEFKYPTSTTYSGENGSYFSFIPNFIFDSSAIYYVGQAIQAVEYPRYNYEEV